MNIENLDLKFDSLLKAVDDSFYTGLGKHTSIFLFGSAATGNWIEGRSDLDLVILLPTERQSDLGIKIREWFWKADPANPIVDGYAILSPGGRKSILRLDELAKVAFPNETRIDLVDQWMIKNRSKKLFGEGDVDNLFPNISINELQAWAIDSLKKMFSGKSVNSIPDVEIVFSKLIWSTSWAARMLMLSNGIVCESKRESLIWLANEYSEINEHVELLLKDFYNSDEQPVSISPEKNIELRNFCFELLRTAGQKI